MSRDFADRAEGDRHDFSEKDGGLKDGKRRHDSENGTSHGNDKGTGGDSS